MTDLADREWRLVREEARPGPLNMALDEIAAESAASEGVRTARVYTWQPSTLSLGYSQDPGTVDWAFCEREGVTVTRRPTGGGGIYHDAVGDISYSLVLPAGEVPGDLMDAYHLLCEPLFDALERLGVDARYVPAERPAVHEPACYLRGLHPAHDVVAGPGGRKISGNAQYRRKDAVVQHGSLSYSLAPDRHLGVFADPPDGAAFRERVGAVDDLADVTRAEAVTALEAALRDFTGAETGGWTDRELDAAEERAAEKYASDDWVRA